MKRLGSFLVYWLFKRVRYGLANIELSSYRANVCSGCSECRWESYKTRRIIGWCGGPLSLSEDVCGCPVVQVPKAEVPVVMLEPTVRRRRMMARNVSVPFRKTLLNKQHCPQKRW